AEKVRDACQAGRMLVVERKAVARQVGPPREEMPDAEEREHEKRRADRARVQPAARGRKPPASGENGTGAAVPVARQGLERRIAVDEGGGQIDVVAVAVGANRGVG